MSTRATPQPATHRSTDAATSRELTAAELDRAGLLHVDPTATVNRFAVFVPLTNSAPGSRS